MLIYNYKKEFLGIDESDLEALGFSDLADLRAEAADFADLFVKTPGHIHNFKHVHWIDYITCNEAGVAAKAIINVKDKKYTTNIDISTIYLVDNPTEKAFMVTLSNIRPLSRSQSEKIATDVTEKASQEAKTEPDEIFSTPSPVAKEKAQTSVTFDPYEEETLEDISTAADDVYESETVVDDFASDEPISIDLGPDEMEIEDVTEEKVQPVAKREAEPVEETVVDENDPFANYTFNPLIASEDLGLPVDLVEEFIQDFIAQADSFKEDLYASAQSGDIDTVKIQSHKLKGVAANLRIEDALDALTIINTSDNAGVIKTNLDRLYRIIHKLSNPGSVEAPVQSPEESSSDEEEFVLSIKDVGLEDSNEPETVAEVENVNVQNNNEEEINVAVDEITFAEDVPEKEIEIDDALVPDSIDVVELQDDAFLKQEVTQSNVSEEDISILDEISENIEEDQETESQKSTVTYNKESVANDIGLDIESFNELFEDYINESQELTTSITNSIQKDNLSACKSSAIKLKGMSENMRVHEFDDELETIINSSSSDSLKDSIETIISKLNQISNAGDK